MATIWKGAITFGLVNIPVELRPAVRTDRLSFRMLHDADMAPIKYERVCSADGEPVPWSDVVKGYEYSKGKFVVLTARDFEEAALEKSKTIDIIDFAKDEEVDPRFFDTPYYLVPSKGGEKAYALLREAVRKCDAVGVGKIIIRQTQHLVGIKAVGDALVLETMRFAHELVDVQELTFPTADIVRPQELSMAEQLVSNLAAPFDPTKYSDDYRANLMRVIKAKMKGTKAKLEEPDEGPADPQVIDLMSRLRESLEQGRGKAAGGKARTSRGGARSGAAPEALGLRVGARAQCRRCGLRGRVRDPQRVPHPGHNGVHVDGGPDQADVQRDCLVVVEQPEAAEQVRPVVLPTAHERQGLGARVADVDRDVPAVLGDPPQRDAGCMPVGAPPEVDDEGHRQHELKKRPAEKPQELSERSEHEVSGLVNREIDGVEYSSGVGAKEARNPVEGEGAREEEPCGALGADCGSLRVHGVDF
jgi:DNA end-binding protein Ku